MHELAPLIKDLAIILAVGGIAALLCQKIRQPVILGYLIAGVIVGPYTPPSGLLSDLPNIKLLSELGVIFLMFALGLEFSFHKLKRVGFSASATGAFEVILMLLIGFLTGKLLGWKFYDCLFLSSALAISSTTIIIKALEELKLKKKLFAEIVFGVLIVEDLLAILLLVGLSTLVTTSHFFSASMLWAVIKLILVVGGWFLIGYFIVPSIFRRIMPYTNGETLIIVSVGLCLSLVCVAAYFHYSTALGAFIMGSILAETPLVSRIEHLILPLRDIFAAVFFISIGMLIDPKIILAHLPTICLLCVVTIFGKLFTAGIGAFSSGQNINNSLRIGFSMAQIGEFSFIIAALGLSLNVVSDFVYPIIVAVSAITTLTTPYLIKTSNLLSDTLDNKMHPQVKLFLERYSTWLYRTISSSKQRSLYKRAATHYLINVLMIGIIFSSTQYWLLPNIYSYFNETWAAKSSLWLLAMLLSSPFIWGMLTAFNGRLKKKVKVNRLVLFSSRLITFVILVLLSLSYFDTGTIFILSAGIVFIFFAILYKRIDQSYHWFVKHLAKNLIKKDTKENIYEHLAPWNTHLVELDVNRHSLLAGKTLQELQLRQKYSINIVAIYRGSDSILGPRGNQVILAFDKLILLINDKHIEKFYEKYAPEIAAEPEPEAILENFKIRRIPLKDKNSLIGKTIRDSNIREAVQGLVVGLERNGTRILNPESKTVMEAGDLIFIVGDKKMVNKICLKVKAN